MTLSISPANLFHPNVSYFDETCLRQVSDSREIIAVRGEQGLNAEVRR